MNEFVGEYVKYLARLSEIKRPKMPNFFVDAYTDNEYRIAIDEIMSDFDWVDDFDISIKFLKGE